MKDSITKDCLAFCCFKWKRNFLAINVNVFFNCFQMAPMAITTLVKADPTTHPHLAPSTSIKTRIVREEKKQRKNDESARRRNAGEISSFILTHQAKGRIGGRYFHTCCPSVTKTMKTRYNGCHTMRCDAMCQIMRTYWLWPGGSS